MLHPHYVSAYHANPFTSALRSHVYQPWTITNEFPILYKLAMNCYESVKEGTKKTNSLALQLGGYDLIFVWSTNGSL